MSRFYSQDKKLLSQAFQLAPVKSGCSPSLQFSTLSGHCPWNFLHLSGMYHTPPLPWFLDFFPPLSSRECFNLTSWDRFVRTWLVAYRPPAPACLTGIRGRMESSWRSFASDVLSFKFLPASPRRVWKHSESWPIVYDLLCSVSLTRNKNSPLCPVFKQFHTFLMVFTFILSSQ